MPGRLQDKRIIITGCGQQYRQGGRPSLRQGGCPCRHRRHRRDGGHATVAEHGAATHFLPVDLAEEADIRTFIEDGVAWLGGLDVLCQNAGPQDAGAITDSTSPVGTACSRSTSGRSSSARNTRCRIFAAPAKGRSSTWLRSPASAAAPA
jgi:NAD(P)-dependent dehydrogenase (short-subunit alcohol dehydrogenase family)